MHMTREFLRSYLENNFGIDLQEIDDTTKLFSEGLLDSFSVVDMLQFIEENGNFIVEPEEVTYDNLDSIESILKFSERKCESVSE